jgi:hypothetical protein
MPKYIKRASSERRAEYTREFRSTKGFGGFSFDCDSLGNVAVEQMRPAAKENYQCCIDGTFDVQDEGVSKREWIKRTRAVIECQTCKSSVSLRNSTNTCFVCNADYNMSGQMLAPRSQWGEETGEHWTECY